MHPNTLAYNQQQNEADQAICSILASHIEQEIPQAENKIWHGHPVWFLTGNPIVGYSKQKMGIRLMFWSGADFNHEKLNIKGPKFKDASIFYQSETDINIQDLKLWLELSVTIQWDYKNLIKKKGLLEKRV